MADEKEVPATIINDLVEEILIKLNELKKKLMYKSDDLDEFSHRVVATYGALILMIEQHIRFMIKNGYTMEHLRKLEDGFMNSFTLLNTPEDPSTPPPVTPTSGLKN